MNFSATFLKYFVSKEQLVAHDFYHEKLRIYFLRPMSVFFRLMRVER